MSRATYDDQLRFLLSCVRYSNNGRVDFVEVAKECGVVSKGAAAKRYERLMKANGISPNAGAAAVTTAVAAPKPAPSKKNTKDPSKKSSAAKKRKLETNSPAPAAEGDEKRLKRIIPTTSAYSEVFGPLPTKSEAFNGAAQHNAAGPVGMPHVPVAPCMFIPRPPQLGQGLPPHATHQRAVFPGFPAYGHVAGNQLVPDMPIYPPFAPVNFGEPWSMPMPSQENGFEDYINQGYVNQHNYTRQPPLSTEGLPLRTPPPPQEVVPIDQPGGRQPEEGEEASKPKDGIVVVVE